MKKKLILLCLILVTVIFNSFVFADDMEKTETEAEVYHFPEIKPELYGLLGYRFLSLSGSEKAGEFEYLHSSVTAGGEIRLFPFPHRFHLEMDVLNKKDYFIDTSYAYKDIFVFRGINRTLYHNLDNITLVDLNTATSSPGVTVKDKGEEYGIKVDLKNLFMRLKTPDYPFHLYLDGRLLNKDGDMQQRFMGGSASFNNQVRASRKRNIDWDAKDITIGANSHTGPIEVDFSHSEKRFDSGGDKVLYDYYTSPTGGRAAGTYPHNLIPELKGSTNTLKLHTSYTGKLVASTTLSKADKENRDSGAKADYLSGVAELTYIPYDRLVFIARYKHKDLDLDNPSSIPAGYLGSSSYTNSVTDIRPSLSSKVDTFSGIVRYKPFRGLGLNAEYTYETIERENADVWEISGDTTRKNITLSASARPLKKLTLKVKYTHQDMDNPAYNTQPNHSDQGSISASWTPFNWSNALLSYNIAEEKRHNIHYVGEESTTDAENRRTKRNRLLGSITFMLLKQLSLTTSYAYIRNQIIQDLIYNSTTNTDQLDKDVLYKDTAHSYGINLNYIPEKNIGISADASQTKGKGGFSPGISAALLPESIASFSELNVKETIYSIGSEYILKGGWTVGLKCKYNSFRDIIDNIYDDAEDGIARIVLVSISKKW